MPELPDIRREPPHDQTVCQLERLLLEMLQQQNRDGAKVDVYLFPEEPNHISEISFTWRHGGEAMSEVSFMRSDISAGAVILAAEDYLRYLRKGYATSLLEEATFRLVYSITSSRSLVSTLIRMKAHLPV